MPMRSNPVKTSSLVITAAVRPLSARRVTRRDGIEPAAAPRPSRDDAELGAVLRSRSPVSSCSSDGNGPPPTRVQYALTTPTTRPIAVGPMPRPMHAPPAMVCELVTYG